MITKLRKHMDAVDTNLELMTIALDGIQSVLTGNGTPDPNSYPAQYSQLVEEQGTIGWTNFLKERQIDNSVGPPPGQASQGQEISHSQAQWHHMGHQPGLHHAQ
jgi:hypothetical protein